MPTPMPLTVDLASSVQVLTDLGLFPIIAIAAVLVLATLIYHRFRK